MAKRTPLFKKVQQIALQMMAAAQARRELKGWGGKCADCGTTTAWSWADEHRDYSYPLSIECVCQSCNHKRGPARLDMFNVETCQWESVLPWTAYVVFTARADVRRKIPLSPHISCTPILL